MSDTEKSTFMKLREDEREVRKALIMDATKTLYEKKAFHEIGMRDIAKKAGVSAATIYRYFPSRDDLFVEALIQDINNIEMLLSKSIEEKMTIEELTIVTIDYLLDNESMFQMMCHFMVKGGINTRVLNKFNAVLLHFNEMVNKILIKIPGAGEDPFFIHAFFASLSGVVMTFRNFPGLTLEDKRKLMHKLALSIINQGDKLSAFKGND